MNKINNLTWKYFLERKFWELVILFSIIYVPYGVGKIGKRIPFELFQNWFGHGNYIGIWFDGFSFIFIGLLIVLSILVFLLWNWNEAEKRAKKKLKKRETRKRGNTHRK